MQKWTFFWQIISFFLIEMSHRIIKYAHFAWSNNKNSVYVDFYVKILCSPLTNKKKTNLLWCVSFSFFLLLILDPLHSCMTLSHLTQITERLEHSANPRIKSNCRWAVEAEGLWTLNLNSADVFAFWSPSFRPGKPTQSCRKARRWR